MLTNLRQHKKDLARETIVAAAFKLFLKNGFDATKVDEIADEAVIARRTFFRYFETKEDVVVAWMDTCRVEIQVRLTENLEKMDPYPALKAAILAQFRHIYADRDYAVAMSRLIFETPSINSLQAAKHVKWRKGFAEVLLQGPMFAKNPMRAHMIASRAVGALVVAYEAWFDLDFKGDLFPLIEKAYKLSAENVD